MDAMHILYWRSPGRSYPSSCSPELLLLPHVVDSSPVMHLDVVSSDVLQKKAPAGLLRWELRVLWLHALGQGLSPLPTGRPCLLPLCPWELLFWGCLAAAPSNFSLSALPSLCTSQGCLCPYADLLPASVRIDIAIYKQAGSELYF